MALFILLGVLTFTCALYMRSLGYLTQIERNTRAACFADNVTGKLRRWAADEANFRAATWATFTNFTDPEFPGFQARVSSRAVDTMSPCTAQEDGRPPSRQVRMVATMKAADVEILWEGQALFSMTMLLREPKRLVRPGNPVVVEPVGGSPGLMAPDANKEYRAVIYDVNGEEINDVKFSWGVQPITGNATITTQTRDGLAATLTNVYILPPGNRQYTGGRCRVVATGTYFGQEYRGLSDEIELAKP